MLRNFGVPLRARDGQTLRVLGIARISSVHQDERSLADQEALYREWLDRNYDGPYELTMIASQGSGEYLERAELLRAYELVESGQFDLVLTEDLGRICRRIQVIDFCETCEDVETRLIALNDNVDTAPDDWRLNSFFAAMRHEAYNRDTGKRIRRSQRNRFLQGGMLRGMIYGYIRSPGATTDDDVQKDPSAQPIYDERLGATAPRRA